MKEETSLTTSHITSGEDQRVFGLMRPDHVRFFEGAQHDAPIDLLLGPVTFDLAADELPLKPKRQAATRAIAAPTKVHHEARADLDAKVGEAASPG